MLVVLLSLHTQCICFLYVYSGSMTICQTECNMSLLINLILISLANPVEFHKDLLLVLYYLFHILMTLWIALLRFLQFAIDTRILYSNRCLNDLMTILNNELCKLSTWFQANKLSVNIKKTHYIAFGGKGKSVRNQSFTYILMVLFLKELLTY